MQQHGHQAFHCFMFEPRVCACLCANNVWYLTVCEYNSYLHILRLINKMC